MLSVSYSLSAVAAKQISSPNEKLALHATVRIAAYHAILQCSFFQQAKETSRSWHRLCVNVAVVALLQAMECCSFARLSRILSRSFHCIPYFVSFPTQLVPIATLLKNVFLEGQRALHGLKLDGIRYLGIFSAN